MINMWQLVLVIILSQACIAQQSQVKSGVLKVENYTEGELTIKVAPFGLGKNEFIVGTVASDGVINFNWPEIDIEAIEGAEFYMSKIDRVMGMTFCNDKQIDDLNETAKAAPIEELSLYKKEKYIGSLYPATEKEIQDNASLNRSTGLVLGSSLSWFYSDSDGNFKAKCTVNLEMENVYDFMEVTAYDMELKKGWNVIQHTLVEKEDWKDEFQQGSLPKTSTKTSITTIPATINWYITYFGK